MKYTFEKKKHFFYPHQLHCYPRKSFWNMYNEFDECEVMFDKFDPAESYADGELLFHHLAMMNFLLTCCLRTDIGALDTRDIANKYE